MKTIGLIGGMSWESTVTYYQLINEAVKAKLGGLHSAKILRCPYLIRPASVQRLPQLWHLMELINQEKILNERCRMKPTVIDPKTTSHAEAYELWMNAPNPMVTFFKTLDVTPLYRISRRRGLKFNMLLCWCIGKAASEVKEFYLLPVGRELLQYDSIAVNTIVKNKNGEVSSCDVPFSTSLAKFNTDYLRLTREVAERCANNDLIESMVIGTSAIVDTEIDGAVGMNSGIFNNPFLIWGKYHKGLFRTTLKLSFQFHHTQMDGAHAGRFLERLQSNINEIMSNDK